MPTPAHHPPARRPPWQRRGVRVAVGVMLVALGMGLAFDAGRQSARRSAGLAPTNSTAAALTVKPAPAAAHPVIDTAPPHVDTWRQNAPVLPAVPLGRRVPTENACGGCHRIADPEIQRRPRPLM